MPQGLITPNNSILYAGQPEIQEMEVETVGEFCPGKLVIVDTADYQCQVAGVDASDVLGVADVPSDQKLTAYFTPSAGGAVTKTFTAGDQIRVLRGDIVVKVILLSGETITVGERLAAAANGMVKAITADGPAEDVVGYALDTPADMADKCCWILMKMTI